MENYIGRMELELAELKERRLKLNKLMGSESYDNLLKEQRILLVQQHSAMTDYETVLSTRILVEKGLAKEIYG